MKKQTLTIGAIFLAAASLALPFQKMGGHTPQASTPVQAKLVKGVQVATILIEGGKYTPSVVSVVKGKPVELTFKGGKHMGCGSTVVFKSLKLSMDIVAGKTALIKFTPKAAGTISYTCGMGMYDGKILVK